jgi:hypothetical protein
MPPCPSSRTSSAKARCPGGFTRPPVVDMGQSDGCRARSELPNLLIPLKRNPWLRNCHQEPQVRRHQSGRCTNSRARENRHRGSRRTQHLLRLQAFLQTQRPMAQRYIGCLAHYLRDGRFDSGCARYRSAPGQPRSSPPSHKASGHGPPQAVGELACIGS